MFIIIVFVYSPVFDDDEKKNKLSIYDTSPMY